MNGNFQPQQWKPTPEQEAFARHLEASHGENFPGIGHRYLTVCQLGKKWNPESAASVPAAVRNSAACPSPHTPLGLPREGSPAKKPTRTNQDKR